MDLETKHIVCSGIPGTIDVDAVESANMQEFTDVYSGIPVLIGDRAVNSLPAEKRKKIVSQSEEWKTVADTHNTQESQLRLLEETMNYIIHGMIVTPKLIEDRAANSLTYEDKSSTLLRRGAVNVSLRGPCAPISEAKSASERRSGLAPTTTSMNEKCSILLSHLKTKRAGYKSQDLAKGIYDEIQFVDIDHIVNLLVDSGLTCYYCRKWTTIFYEFVRDPRQWSLERLSNDQGHNCGNVVIACLECNMHRRTMYHERYLATKQLRVNKLP